MRTNTFTTDLTSTDSPREALVADSTGRVGIVLHPAHVDGDGRVTEQFVQFEDGIAKAVATDSLRLLSRDEATAWRDAERRKGIAGRHA